MYDSKVLSNDFEKFAMSRGISKPLIENYSTQFVIPQVLEVYETAIRKVG